MRDRNVRTIPGIAMGERRTVLLTGASGVVGQALLKRLRGFDVVCLTHRTSVKGSGIRCVQGDVTELRFGLSSADYAELAGQVEAVIHCAAITDFHRSDGSLESTNVDGTSTVATFAKDADAIMYHVSTAFRDAQVIGERGVKAVAYAASKRSGEQVVRDSGVRHVILRPSIVIGDSRTGEVATFQGLHQVAAAIASDSVPMIPFSAEWPLDFVPSDFVADAIATVVENGVSDGEFWITAGPHALRLDEAVAICLRVARNIGAEISEPRFVPPDLFDRLIGPVFFGALPRRLQFTVSRLLEFFTIYLAAGKRLPCSHQELVALGVRALPNQKETLGVSLDFWAHESGFVDRYATREIA